MTRGRHKRSADARRDREELVREADEGQRRAEKAEAELAELTARSQKLIEGLRAELAQVARERDEASSPALEAAHARSRELNQELLTLRKSMVAVKKSYETSLRAQVIALTEEARSIYETVDLPEAEKRQVTERLHNRMRALNAQMVTRGAKLVQNVNDL